MILFIALQSCKVIIKWIAHGLYSTLNRRMVVRMRNINIIKHIRGADKAWPYSSNVSLPDWCHFYLFQPHLDSKSNKLFPNCPATHPHLRFPKLLSIPSKQRICITELKCYLFYLNFQIYMWLWGPVVAHLIVEPYYFHIVRIYIYHLCYGQFIARIQLFLRLTLPLELKVTIITAFT